MDKTEYTKQEIHRLFSEAINDLKAIPAELQEEFPKAIIYKSDINKYDLATIKAIGKTFNKKTRDFRCEVGILFDNDKNIDQDYIFAEIYRLK
jgi:hypothetical protein